MRALALILAAVFATTTVGVDTASAQHWKPRKTAVHKAATKKRSAKHATPKKPAKKPAKRSAPRRPLP